MSHITGPIKPARQLYKSRSNYLAQQYWCLLLVGILAQLAFASATHAQAINITANSSGFATDPHMSSTNENLWVTWLEYDAQLGVNSVHAYGYFYASGVERIRVDTANDEYLSPQVAALADGGAWFTWVKVLDEGALILARHRTPTGWSTPPIQVSSSSISGAFPSIALDESERPCIAWESSAAWGREIAMSCWDGTGFIEAPSPSKVFNSAYEPRLVRASDDAVWAVWQERRSSNYEIMARRFVDGDWGNEIQVTQATDANGIHMGLHVLPRVAAGDNGAIWISWISKQLHNKRSNGWVTDREIQLSLVTSGGTILPIQQVPLDDSAHHPIVFDQDGGPDTASIAIAGNKLFVFYRRLVSETFRWDLLAQVSPVGTGQWLNTPLNFNAMPTPQRFAGYPSAASLTVSNDTVLATWQADNRPFHHSPWAPSQPESDIFLQAATLPASASFDLAGEAPAAYETPLKYDYSRATDATPHTGIPLVLLQGDLHAHTVNSHDGQGGNDLMRENIRRAHDNGRLGFYTLTDHALHSAPADWHTQQKLRSIYARTGDMQMLLGLEYTHDGADPQGRKYGHQNVILRNARSPLYSRITHETPTDLWSALPLGDSVAIPHHTGDSGHTYSLDEFDQDYVRLFEIFQERESYECWCCKRVGGDGDSCDNLPNINVAPENGGAYFQDALALGQRMGAIASPDHHGFKGLAGVYALSNSREDIFDALHARRTFGVTNYAARMTLDFRADGHMMGEEYNLSGTCPTFYLNVSTDYLNEYTGNSGTIEEIKLYRVTNAAPGEEGEILKLSPQNSGFSTVFHDADCPLQGSASYYLRAEQDWDLPLRRPLGWTSPVFINWVSDTSSRDAAKIQPNFPLSVEVGETVAASIAMTNIGDITWTDLEQYGLKLKNETLDLSDLSRAHYLETGEFARFGDSMTWQINFTAPDKPGFHILRWQMTSPAGDFGQEGATVLEVREVGQPPGC
jgi:Protein of unknown function (DUF3604)